ncbi:MAG: class I adenylate-forming enzyme family protein [Noviherbaspirillum sp.]
MIKTLADAVRISDVPRYWAQHAPDAIALFDSGAPVTPVTYAALWRTVLQAREVLQENGVQAGDRVMLVSENCAAQVVLLFAISELGAWPVTVNARLSEREIEVIRVHCEPRLQLFTTGISPDARAHAQRCRAREIRIGGVDGWGGLAASATDKRARPEPAAIAQLVAALIYTSGTTGTPKGVMISHRGLLSFAQISSASRRMSASDIAHGVLPMSHIFGLATLLMATLYAGASVYLEPRFTAEGTFKALAAGGVSILQGVPTMYTRLLSYLDEHRMTAHAPRLRYVYTGGAPLDPAQKRAVEATFGLPLHHGYGMTEYAGSLFITDIDNPRSDCSAGRIIADAELKTVDEQGRDLPPGTPGEIWVRGIGTMLGYYRAPELTAQALMPGGWLNTGDIGRVDPDGALHILGRTKDLIICSGFNVYPIEVEAVINSFPAIRQSAVVGRSTADCNEEVVAFVERSPGATLDLVELREYLKARLSPYKRPVAIHEIEVIPTTASGKLLKNGLRKMAADEAVQS